jgi:membrane protease YdiL (CAAX protease family)
VTEVRAVRSAGVDRAETFAVAALVSIGVLALLARRYVLGTPHQSAVVAEIYLGLALVSLAVPLGALQRRPRLATAWVLAIGVLAFAAATFLVPPPFPLPRGPEVLALNTLAAFGEEAFFRRLVYGVLERWGASLAIAGSALLFALIHVPLYGTAAVWVDLGAGLVLSWQRWASGTWTASGATHAAANLLAVLR